MVGPGQGNLCVKGRFGYDFISSDERLTKPLIKKDGKLVEADVGGGARAGRQESKRGQEARAAPTRSRCSSSARSTNEENYLLQKFTRAVIGTNNVDHCARL